MKPFITISSFIHFAFQLLCVIFQHTINYYALSTYLHTCIYIYRYRYRCVLVGAILLDSDKFVVVEERVQEMEAEIEMVGRAFVEHYYQLFDHNRDALATLYQPVSMLTFEGQKILGVADISDKLKQLPFDQCRHSITTVDSQPLGFAGGIMVFVTGCLQLQGEDHPLRFTQVCCSSNIAVI